MLTDVDDTLTVVGTPTACVPALGAIVVFTFTGVMLGTIVAGICVPSMVYLQYYLFFSNNAQSVVNAVTNR